MDPVEFLKTIYFGDRYCTKIVIDSKNANFELHVNSISRIRDLSGQWNYYTDEDIENGIIVFTDIKKLYFEPIGLIPNDEIYNIYANNISENEYEFIIETCNVDNHAKCSDLKITLLAKSIYLKDPLKTKLITS